MRIALALVVLAAVSVLWDVAGYLWLLTPWSLNSLDPDESMLMMIAVVIILVTLVSVALWLATVALSILTMVWGRGAMRFGALLVLIPVTVSAVFSADVSGSSDDAWSPRAVLDVIAIAADLIGLAIVTVGIVLLLRGIRQAQRR